MLVTKALSHDVTILAFVPLSLIPLEALLCIESVAADALTALHSMCSFFYKIGCVVELKTGQREATTSFYYL